MVAIMNPAAVAIISRSSRQQEEHGQDYANDSLQRNSGPIVGIVRYPIDHSCRWIAPDAANRAAQ